MGKVTNKPLTSTEAVRLSSDVSRKDRFKILMLRQGINQNDIANFVGISKATMSEIVNEKWYPSTRLMIKIADYLETDSVAIFGDDECWSQWNEKIIYEDRRYWRRHDLHKQQLKEDPNYWKKIQEESDNSDLGRINREAEEREKTKLKIMAEHSDKQDLPKFNEDFK